MSAVTSWVKALQMYKADNGDFPAIISWTVRSNFLTVMAPYVSTPPAPSNKNVNGNDPTSQFRGALFWYVSASDVRIYVNLFGNISAYTNCPTIGGLGSANGGTSRVNGYTCNYKLSLALC